MEATVFNPAQVYLLHMFERITTEEELLDIKKLISDYFATLISISCGMMGLLTRSALTR